MQRKKPNAYAWQKLINDILRVMSITQCQLAKEIGVANNSINGWLSGRTRPKPKYHIAIVGYCVRHNIENLCEKYGFGDLVRPAKELEKAKRGNFVTAEIPIGLLSGALKESLIEIHGELYKIVKIKNEGRRVGW